MPKQQGQANKPDTHTHTHRHRHIQVMLAKKGANVVYMYLEKYFKFHRTLYKSKKSFIFCNFSLNFLFYSELMMANSSKFYIILYHFTRTYIT